MGLFRTGFMDWDWKKVVAFWLGAGYFVLSLGSVWQIAKVMLYGHYLWSYLPGLFSLVLAWALLRVIFFWGNLRSVETHRNGSSVYVDGLVVVMVTVSPLNLVSTASALSRNVVSRFFRLFLSFCLLSGPIR